MNMIMLSRVRTEEVGYNVKHGPNRDLWKLKYAYTYTNDYDYRLL